ncbi:homocysteine S-methyltransferase family protein [Temperatibacter marinus]|uniref:Homocysteine S-methyltransferase family protein n=1 Tax=Temperatibacter marinus TaxID=1456591 RepID=A0AA52EKG5_9PROT|nr:homocysteine S-methyltransferase family protein [Temperatibacter marinus]WND03884.1 homocysteine S-methyltransferase family protein [Temperatibacter marinus]
MMEAVDKIIIMDGAMGTELRARGARVADYKSSAWSAFALLEDPDVIEEIHLDYILAGARVITANNYAVTSSLLERAGLEARQEELLKQAVELALKARKRAGISSVKIAASLPPLNTSYQSDLVGDFDHILTEYQHIAHSVKHSVDMFICETMTTISEAKAAARAGCATGVPTFVSFTLEPSTGKLRGGETIEALVTGLADLPIAGFLFNCCDCHTILKMLPELSALVTVPIGAYANPVLHEPLENGEPEQVIAKPLNAEEYADQVVQWVQAGATYVGGCCDTSPAYIQRMKQKLNH